MPRIDEMYAYISTDADENDEGIVGFHTGKEWIPCVGADMDRMNSLRPMAEMIATKENMTLLLVKFSTRTELEVIEP